ncbi:MAG: response regulator [Epsilonproteobacteria bacterium]|nr:response regulator [Campylobacterota bacterium]
MYKNILAVSIDDNEQNLILLEVFAKDIGLDIKNFSDSLKAFDFICKNDVDIIFTDYMMPELDGLELIRGFRILNKATPIIMITAGGENIRADALKAGATDFLNKPLDLAEFTVRTKNLLELRAAQIQLKDRAKQLEVEIQKATEDIVDREHESLIVLGKTAEYKDPETANHINRVAHYSKLLAKKYGLSKKKQDLIFYSSPFHDIGKVGIKDAILLKPAKLTDAEFKVMKTHSKIGFEILKNAKSKYLQMGSIIALNHHEKYDGTGYPNKIRAEKIPIEARIVAIADVFDALVSHRPYKQAWSFEDAISLLIKEKTKHFDPMLVDIFIQNIKAIKKINKKFGEN